MRNSRVGTGRGHGQHRGIATERATKTAATDRRAEIPPPAGTEGETGSARGSARGREKRGKGKEKGNKRKRGRGRESESGTETETGTGTGTTAGTVSVTCCSWPEASVNCLDMSAGNLHVTFTPAGALALLQHINTKFEVLKPG